MKRGDELTVRLESAAYEGKNITHVDGLAVFVRGGAPGDELVIRIGKTKKSFAEADAVRVISPSPLRTEPRCRYFGTCGGCKWQHIAYPAQLEFKRQHVVDALERIGGFHDVPVHATLGTDDSYLYRNKMEFSFGQRWRTAQEMTELNGEAVLENSFALGLHIPERFDRVLDLEECWLQSEVSAAIVNEVRRFSLEHALPIYSTETHEGYLRNLVIREARHTGELMVNLVTRDKRPAVMEQLRDDLLQKFQRITTIVNNITDRKSQVAVGDEEIVYHGTGFITERIGRRVYRISANSFFQTNTLQAERLYDTARRMGRLQASDTVYDLYCGTGTIALHVADDVARVIGIEAVPSAIDDARKNAEENGVTNCTFLLGDLKETLVRETGWLNDQGAPDVVIVDPPRVGLHEKAARHILGLAPRRIVYVSCNPATQARDLKILCENDVYAIEEVQPVDMFPHTFHIENVCGLVRRS